MDSLEKLFLSCLVLFGMFILFLFGLYFDLGDMLAATFRHDEKNATGVGVTDNLIQQMEARARPREVMPTALDLPRASGADAGGSLEEMLRASAHYAGNHCVAPLTGKQLTAIKRAQLQQAGVQREEVLELESLGADRDDALRAVREAKRLASEKRFVEASKLLAEAVAQTNPKNLLALKELLGLEVQVTLDAKQVDKAREAARKLYETLDRILIVRSLEGAQPGMDQELAQLRAEKDRLDSLYADMQKRLEETGSPTGMTATEKTQIKESFTKSRNEGKMSEEEYQRAIKELES